VVAESASVTVQLLGRSQSVSSTSVFNYVMMIAGKFYGMRLLQSFNVVYGFRKGLYFIEN